MSTQRRDEPNNEENQEDNVGPDAARAVEQPGQVANAGPPATRDTNTADGPTAPNVGGTVTDNRTTAEVAPPLDIADRQNVTAETLDEQSDMLSAGVKRFIELQTVMPELFTYERIADKTLTDYRFRMTTDRYSAIRLKFVEIKNVLSMSDLGQTPSSMLGDIHPSILSRMHKILDPQYIMVLSSKFLDDGTFDTTPSENLVTTYVYNATSVPRNPSLETGIFIDFSRMIMLIVGSAAEMYYAATAVTQGVNTTQYQIAGTQFPSYSQDEYETGFHSLLIAPFPIIRANVTQWLIQSGISEQLGRHNTLAMAGDSAKTRVILNGTCGQDPLTSAGRNLMTRRLIESFGRYSQYTAILQYLRNMSTSVFATHDTVNGFASYPLPLLTQNEIRFAMYAILSFDYGRQLFRGGLSGYAIEAFKNRFDMRPDVQLMSLSASAPPNSAWMSFFGAISGRTDVDRVSQLTACAMMSHQLDFRFTCGPIVNSDASIFLRLFAIAIVFKRYPQMLNASGKQTLAIQLYEVFTSTNSIDDENFRAANGWAGQGTEPAPTDRFSRVSVPSYFAVPNLHPNQRIRNYLMHLVAPNNYNYVLPTPPTGLPNHGNVTVELCHVPSDAPGNGYGGAYLKRTVDFILAILKNKTTQLGKAQSGDLDNLAAQLKLLVTSASAVDPIFAETQRMISHSPFFIPVKNPLVGADVGVGLTDVLDLNNDIHADVWNKSVTTIDLIEVVRAYARLVVDVETPINTVPTTRVFPPFTGEFGYMQWHSVMTKAWLASEAWMQANEVLGYLGAMSDAGGVVVRNGLVPFFEANRMLMSKHNVYPVLRLLVKAYNIDDAWFRDTDHIRISNPAMTYLVPDNNDVYRPVTLVPPDCSSIIDGRIRMEALIDNGRYAMFRRIVGGLVSGRNFPFVNEFFVVNESVNDFSDLPYDTNQNTPIITFTAFVACVEMRFDDAMTTRPILVYNGNEYVSNFPDLYITIAPNEYVLLDQIGVRDILRRGFYEKAFGLHFTNQILVLEYEYITKSYIHDVRIEDDFFENMLNISLSKIIRRKFRITIQTPDSAYTVRQTQKQYLRLVGATTMTPDPQHGPWSRNPNNIVMTSNNPQAEYYSLYRYGTDQMNADNASVIDVEPQQTLSYEICLLQEVGTKVPPVGQSLVSPQY